MISVWKICLYLQADKIKLFSEDLIKKKIKRI